MNRFVTTFVFAATAVLLPLAVSGQGLPQIPGPIGEIPNPPVDDLSPFPTAQIPCPRSVTLQACTTPGALTYCTLLEQQRLIEQCPVLLEELQAAETGEWSTSDMLTVDTADVVNGPQLPAPIDEMTYDGFYGSYAAQHLASRATHDDGGGDTRRARNIALWETNCAVTSCDEYVYDKYYEYERFEAFTGPLGEDYRAIYNGVYGADGIARTTLRGVSGQPLPPIEFGARRDGRNEYIGYDIETHPIEWTRVAQRGGFSASPDFADMPSVLPGCPFVPLANQFVCDGTELSANRDRAALMNERLHQYDAARMTAMVGQRAPSPPMGADWWDFHEQAAAALSTVSDVRLLWLEARQREFADMVDRRQSLAASINEALIWIEVFETAYLMPAADRSLGVLRATAWLQGSVEALAEVDAQLVSEIEFAEQQGCLAPTAGMGPCDWSPRWLADAVQHQFLVEREQDYQNCIAHTGNDFSRLIETTSTKLHWLEQAKEEMTENFCLDDSGTLIEGCYVRDNYLRNAELVESYFTTVDGWFSKLPLPIDPGTGRPILAETASDNASHGDSLFAIEYGYSFGWQGRNLETDNCDLSVASHANTNLDAVVFGYDTAKHGHLLELSGSSDVGEDAFGASVDLTILGQNIYEGESAATPAVPGDPTRIAFNFIASPQRTETESKTETFFVGWVPFTFSAGLSGTIGLNIEMQSTFKGCQGGVNNEASSSFLLSPFANASAYAGVAVGVSGVSLGVRGTVVVFDLSLPFSSTATLDGANNELFVNADLTMHTNMLAGQVDLVAELLVKTYKRRLFGWSGLSWDTPLVDSRFTFPLDVLRILITGGQEPAEPSRFSVRFPDGCLTPAITPEPTLYLSFDNEWVNTGANTVDDEVGGYTFDYSGAVTVGATGVFGEGFDFGGTSGHLTAQVANLPPNSGDFTYAFWARPDSGGTLLQRGTDSTSMRLFFRGPSQHMVLKVACDGYQREQETPFAGNQMFTGRNGYHHVAVAHADGTTTLTVDGDRRGTIYCTPEYSDATLRLGEFVDSFGGALYLDGSIDEFAYYDGVALDYYQIYELFERGAAGRPIHGDGAVRPSGVTGLTATPGNNEVTLSWGNPIDLGGPGSFETVSIRASSTAVPAIPSDGFELFDESVNAGNHNPARNGTTFYYTAFALRADGSYLRGPSVSATPTGGSMSTVTDAVATGGAGHVQLTWTNPTRSNFEMVEIIRRADAPPVDEHDGTVIYQGTGSECMDQRVAPGVTYYYALFAADWYFNMSAPVTVSASPTATAGSVDITAPLPISDLAATSSASAIQLSWTNPPDSDFDHVEIIRSTLATMGSQLIYEGSGATYVDSLVRQGRGYRYRLNAFDTAGNRSPSRSMTVTAFDQNALQPATKFTATGIATGINLGWTNPNDTGFAGVVIRRSSLRPPSSPQSGIPVVQFQATNYLDTNVNAGVTYYYSVFAYNVDGLYAAPATSSATAATVDVTPPAPVSDLVGEAGINAAILTWRLPIDGDFDRVVVRADNAPIVGPDDGWLLLEGLETVFIDDTREGTYYGVFTYDLAGNASAPVTVYVDPIPAALRIVANAGDDQAVLAGDTVTLDASASIALDGQTLTSYRWRQVAGPQVAFDDFTAAQTHFIAPQGDQVLVFELEVDDDSRAGTDTVTVTVEAFAATRIGSASNPHTTIMFPGQRVGPVSEDARGYLYVGAGGLNIFDAATLNLISSTPGLPGGQVQGTLLYDTGCVYGVALVDVTDPAQPVAAPTYQPEGCSGPARLNDNVGVVRVGNTLHVVTVDATPSFVEQSTIPGPGPYPTFPVRVWELHPTADVLYVLGAGNNRLTSGFYVYDLSTPSAPTLAGQVSLSAGDQDWGTMHATADYLFVDFVTRFAVYDLSDPLTPNQIVSANDRPNQAAVSAHALGTQLAVVSVDGLIEVLDFASLPALNISPLTFPDSSTGVAGNSLLTLTNDGKLWARRLMKNGDITSGGVLIYDLATQGMPNYPTILASRRPLAIDVSGQMAAVISREGLSMVDISALPAMSETGFVASTQHIDTSNNTVTYNVPPLRSPVIYSGDYVYSTRPRDPSTVVIFDVTDPATPSIASTLALTDRGCEAGLKRADRLYLGCRSGVVLVDVSDPTTPVQLDTVALNHGGTVYIRLISAEDLLLSGGQSRNLAGPVSFIDIRNPSSLAFRETLALADADALVTNLSEQRSPLRAEFDLHASQERWFSLNAVRNPPSAGYSAGPIRGLLQHPVDSAGLSALVEAQYSLPTAIRTWDPWVGVGISWEPLDLVSFGDYVLVANDNRGLHAVPVRPLQLGASYTEEPVSSVLAYPLSFSEPDSSRQSELLCKVTGGTCVVSAIDHGAHTATVTWTLPATAGDHEMMVSTGHAQYYTTTRERVRVTP